MTRLKIVHVFWNGEMGGRENLVYQMACEQQKDQTIQVDVFLGAKEGYFYELLLKNGVRVYGLEDEGKGYIGAIKVFESYDIVHYHGLNMLLMMLGIFSGAKLIFTLHGIRAVTIYSPVQMAHRLLRKIFVRGKKGRSDNGSPVLVKSGNLLSVRDFRGIFRVIKRYFFHLFIENYCQICTVNSEFLKTKATRTYNVSPAKFRVIFNSIDTSKLQPTAERKTIRSQENIADNEFVIGTIARLVPVKCLDRLIEGYSIFRTAHGNIPSKLIIVGQGPMRDELEKLASKLDLKKFVRFTGFVNETSNLRSVFDVFTISSGYGDTFPIAALEAMYMRIPTVIFEDSGGLPEVITHQRNGYVVRDVKELANCLHGIYQSRSNTNKITEKAYTDVISKFNISRFASDYKKLYLELNKD